MLMNRLNVRSLSFAESFGKDLESEEGREIRNIYMNVWWLELVGSGAKGARRFGTIEDCTTTWVPGKC